MTWNGLTVGNMYSVDDETAHECGGDIVMVADIRPMFFHLVEPGSRVDTAMCSENEFPDSSRRIQLRLLGANGENWSWWHDEPMNFPWKQVC